MDQPSEQPIQEMLSSRDGILTIGQGRAVVVTEASYVFLMKVIQEHAPHILKYAFYDMGYRVGQELMGAVQERAENPEAAFRRLVEIYEQSGYGNLEVSLFDLDQPEARLLGVDLFETSVARKADIFRSPRCVCHYSRGIFSGFLSNLLGREVVCEELSCQFRGEERCEFVVLPFEGSET